MTLVYSCALLYERAPAEIKDQNEDKASKESRTTCRIIPRALMNHRPDLRATLFVLGSFFCLVAEMKPATWFAFTVS